MRGRMSVGCMELWYLQGWTDGGKQNAWLAPLREGRKRWVEKACATVRETNTGPFHPQRQESRPFTQA